MRKVVLYQLLSLDGVAEEPGDWLFDSDRAIFENLGRVIQGQDAVLLGRKTYDYWVGDWPTSDVEPFASFINGTQKHVFTSSGPWQEWANSVWSSRQRSQATADGCSTARTHTSEARPDRRRSNPSGTLLVHYRVDVRTA